MLIQSQLPRHGHTGSISEHCGATEIGAEKNSRQETDSDMVTERGKKECIKQQIKTTE